MKKFLVVLCLLIVATSVMFAGSIDFFLYDSDYSDIKLNFLLDSLINDKSSVWFSKNYVDEYQDPTGRAYITSGIQTGSFSNSVTTNSTLTYRFIVDPDCIRITLYEYGMYEVKNTSIWDFYTDYTLNFKSNFFSEVVTATGYVTASSGGIVIDDAWAATVLFRMLAVSDLVLNKYSPTPTLDVYIYPTNDPSTTYLLKNVNLNGFTSAYMTYLYE